MDIAKKLLALLVAVVACAVVIGCGGRTETASGALGPAPTTEPTSAPIPIASPVVSPTESPTAEPTAVPTASPTSLPTQSTIALPTESPIELEPLQTSLLQEQYCVVDITTPDTLNVRTGPSASEEIVTELQEGECRIYVFGDPVDGWREVAVDRDGGSLRGWVSGNYIAPLRAPIDPDAPTIVATFAVEYTFDAPESEQPLDAFQLTDANGLVIGFLDANGQINVPADLDLGRTTVSAEWADDRYCAWSGQPEFQGVNNEYVVPLFGLCA